MYPILQLKTEVYQVYDLGYGALLINRNPKTVYEGAEAGDVKCFPNLFMQGDEAINFLNDVEKMETKKVSQSGINSALSQYEDVMELISEKELNKIGVQVSAKRNKKVI